MIPANEITHAEPRRRGEEIGAQRAPEKMSETATFSTEKKNSATPRLRVQIMVAP